MTRMRMILSAIQVMVRPKVTQIVIALSGSLGLTVAEKPTFWGFGEPDDTPVFTDDGWQQPLPGREPRIVN